VSQFPRTQRRAFRLLGLCRSSGRYVSRFRDDLPLRQRIRAIAEARPRFGYRRIYILLKREGYRVGDERVRRLYREEGLSLRLKPKHRRKLASNLRALATPPTGASATLVDGFHARQPDRWQAFSDAHRGRYF
jgi:putative transposase